VSVIVSDSLGLLLCLYDLLFQALNLCSQLLLLFHKLLNDLILVRYKLPIFLQASLYYRRFLLYLMTKGLSIVVIIAEGQLTGVGGQRLQCGLLLYTQFDHCFVSSS
jgi:hypothetical protein